MTRRRDDPEAFDGRRLRNNLPPGTPWWLRLALLGGIPPVGLLLILGLYTGWIHVPGPGPTPTTALADVLREHDRKADLLILRLTTALRIMCENQARDLAQQRNCGNIQ